MSTPTASTSTSGPPTSGPSTSGTPIRRILAATDFSPQAWQALQRAALLARQHGAELTLIHAFEHAPLIPAWGDPGGGAWVDEEALVDSTRAHLERARDELAEAYGLKIGASVEVGAVHRQILARADGLGADLVVIAASGASGLARRLFGSSAQSIVRTARHPVLVVRAAAKADYGRLLIGTDFSDDAGRAARFALELAPAAKVCMSHSLEQSAVRIPAPLGLQDSEREEHLARARDMADKALQSLAAELGRENARLRVSDGHASQTLIELAVEWDADLLAIGAHGKSRLEAGLIGSTSLHAISDAPCDVLVTPRVG